MIGARKGQHMKVSMATKNGTNYFNILADPGEFHASREGDLTIVRIRDERYEIPAAVISGD